ncbi:hypothetical protein T439DRAFT_352542 [Meredithblackwellia eburnea MCA 4105]
MWVVLQDQSATAGRVEAVRGRVQEVWDAGAARWRDFGSQNDGTGDKIKINRPFPGGKEELKHVLSLTPPRPRPESPPGTTLKKPVKVRCTSELLKEAHDPSFWIVEEKMPNMKFQISPRSGARAPCLSDAVFSARLVKFSSTPNLSPNPEVIYPLPSPTPITKGGKYELYIGSDLMLPLGQYQLEVILEFGSLPGARIGQLCGARKPKCVGETLPGDPKYLGKRVWVKDIETLTLGQTTQVSGGERSCASFSTLHGHWEEAKFRPWIPSVSGEYEGTCSLHNPSLPLPESNSNLPVWLHFIGDSNTRYLHWYIWSILGNGRNVSSEAVESPIRNGTVATLWAWTPATSLSPQQPKFFITWHWWAPLGKDFDDEGDSLANLTNATLGEFISRANLSHVVEEEDIDPNFWSTWEDLRPTRTYISFGSHSERLTASGNDQFFDTLFVGSAGQRPYLPDSVIRDANVRFVTTTEVATGRIPIQMRHSRGQQPFRTNVVIEAKNDVLRRRPEAKGRIIDAEGLTRGITQSDYMMVFTKGKWGQKHAVKDFVHFHKSVYAEWTRILWTELIVGGWD